MLTSCLQEVTASRGNETSLRISLLTIGVQFADIAVVGTVQHRTLIVRQLSSLCTEATGFFDLSTHSLQYRTETVMWEAGCCLPALYRKDLANCNL